MLDERFSGRLPRFDEFDPAAYDDTPLWSAPFGLKLLEVVELRPNLRVLDVGSGNGFPALELASRLGSSSRVHGVDPWRGGLERARLKIEAHGLYNVTLHEARAEALPLATDSIDLVTSNNGFNNMDKEEQAVAECARVARPGAQLVYAYNLPEGLREFYDVYEAVLDERGQSEARDALQSHILDKRKPIAFMASLFERNGFGVERVLRASFPLRFLDATAMFAHFFMRIAFLPPWLGVLEPNLRTPIFREIETRLNTIAKAKGCLTLTVYLACFDCRRQS